MAYPTDIDSYTPVEGTTLLAPTHNTNHNVAGSAIVALENKLGLGSGSASADRILVGSGVGTTAWGTVWNNGALGSPTVTGGTLANLQLIGTSQITGGTVSSALIGTSTMQGGTANGVVMGTPMIGTVTVPGTVAPLSFSRGIVSGVVSLTDAVGTINTNAQAGQTFELICGTAAGLRIFAIPSNPTDGQIIEYRIQQNASNTGTITFVTAAPGAFRFVPGDAPALGTQSTWNYYSFRYNLTAARWDYRGNIVGLI